LGIEHQIIHSTYHIIEVFQQILKRLSAFRHYRNDQSGIIKRYLTENENWNEHLVNSKNYILNALPSTQLESIAVLGSGWLLDVPVDELLKRTNFLVLYDIFHPNQIVNKYKNNSCVKFVKIDLTNNLIEGVIKSKNIDEFMLLLKQLTPLRTIQSVTIHSQLNPSKSTLKIEKKFKHYICKAYLMEKAV